MVSRTWKGLKVVGNYEFDLELKERLNKRKGEEEEEEDEQDVRNWTSASCEPRLVGQMNGITASASVQNADTER